MKQAIIFVHFHQNEPNTTKLIVHIHGKLVLFPASMLVLLVVQRGLFNEQDCVHVHQAGPVIQKDC